MRDFIVFLVFLGLVGCTEIKFSQPQPQGIPNIGNMPEVLLGTWYATGEEYSDTLIITKSRFWFVSDTSNGKLSEGKLAPNDFFRKQGKDYFLNSGTEQDGYTLVWIRFVDEYTWAILYLKEDETGTVERLKGMLRVNEVLDESGKIKEYVLSPTVDQFQQLLGSGVFTEVMRIKKVGVKTK